MPLPSPDPRHPAIVTGASSGIGRELARLLARRGHTVVPVARRADALDALAAELAPHAPVRPIVADLTVPAGRDELADELDRAGILVNCAGAGPVRPVADGGRDAELTCVEVNVTALVDLTSRAVPGMIARGRGAILDVASTAAFMPVPGQAVYAASKAFVLDFTHALRQELAGTGVTVSALCPGPVRTGFAAANGTTDDRLFAGLPESMILPVEQVAAAGLAGLEADRAVVVPGRLNAAMATVTRLLPRRLLLPALASSAPGLARHRTAEPQPHPTAEPHPTGEPTCPS